MRNYNVERQEKCVTCCKNKTHKQKKPKNVATIEKYFPRTAYAKHMQLQQRHENHKTSPQNLSLNCKKLMH